MTTIKEFMTQDNTPEVNEGKERIVRVQVPVRVFDLKERKAAVMFALRTHGQMFVWASDGNSDWLRRGDQSDCPDCFVVVDPEYNLPDFVQLVPIQQDFSMHDPNMPLDAEGEQIVLDMLHEQLYAQEAEDKQAPEVNF